MRGIIYACLVVFVVIVMNLEHYIFQQRCDSLQRQISNLSNVTMDERLQLEQRIAALERRHDLLVAASRTSWAAAHRLMREGLLERAGEE